MLPHAGRRPARFSACSIGMQPPWMQGRDKEGCARIAASDAPHLDQVLCKWPPIHHSVLRPPDLGCGHQLHGVCDLLRAPHRVDAIPRLLQPGAHLASACPLAQVCHPRCLKLRGVPRIQLADTSCRAPAELPSAAQGQPAWLQRSWRPPRRLWIAGGCCTPARPPSRMRTQPWRR
jgi:hypothetical protein